MTTGSETAPPLWGVVLAGGQGRRIGRDKGQLRYHGEPQARYAHRLLEVVCAQAFVSVRPGQAAAGGYAQLPLILDAPGGSRGPAAGLLAAWRHQSAVAWLVLATDLPLVDEGVLAALTAARDPARLATAFRHADGTPEPLCTIWEPAARAALQARVAAGDNSLRRLLEASAVRLVEPVDPDRLINVNSPEDYDALRERI